MESFEVSLRSERPTLAGGSAWLEALRRSSDRRAWSMPLREAKPEQEPTRFSKPLSGRHIERTAIATGSSSRTGLFVCRDRPRLHLQQKENQMPVESCTTDRASVASRSASAVDRSPLARRQTVPRSDWTSPWLDHCKTLLGRSYASSTSTFGQRFEYFLRATRSRYVARLALAGFHRTRIPNRSSRPWGAIKSKLSSANSDTPTHVANSGHVEMASSSDFKGCTAWPNCCSNQRCTVA